MAALLGTDPGLAPLTQMLVKRGNPFFLEETVRTLVETGALAGARGAYRLTRPLEALQVPATVQTILAARIARLPAEEKQLLQTASVIGKHVPYALVAAIAEQPEDKLRRGLVHLQEAEFLYETQLFPDLGYTFKHALTHEVTYASMLHDRRRALHARIVESIERLHPDRLSEHIDQLAHHASRGEMWDEAAPYLREAGLKALARSAVPDAANYFEQALGALQHLPESPVRHERAIDLAFDLRTALLPLGGLQRISERLTTAEALAKVIGDRRRLGMISVYLCINSYLICDHDRALAAAEQATTCGDVGAETVGTIYRTLVHHTYQQAIEAARRGLTALEAHPMGERFRQFILPGVTARTYLALTFAEVGLCDDAVAIGRQGVEAASTVDHPPSRMTAHWGRAAAWLAVGRHADAILDIERAVELCRDLGLLAYLHNMAPTVGAAYVAGGRGAEAIVVLEEILREPATRMIICFRAPALAVLGEAHLHTGDVAGARRHAEAAQTLAREHGQRGYEARIAYLLGEIASQDEPQDVDTAAAHYHAGLALAADLGMRPLVAHNHAGLAKLYRRASRRQQVDTHLAAATTMYREMGMTYWLEKAEAETNRLGWVQGSSP